MITLLKKKVKEGLNTLQREQKVAMLHPGRCGSTVLGSLMSQHSQMYWWGEPFENLMKKGNSLNKKQVVKTIKNAESAVVSKVFSFAIKYPKGMHLSSDCINMSIDEYISLIEGLGYKKFIVITRSNHLKRAISMENGRQSKQWHSEKKADKPSSVTINPKRFEVGIDYYLTLEEYFKTLDSEFERLQKALKYKNVLYLTYENDIEENPIDAYNKVCDFIDVKREIPEIKYNKTNPFPIKDLVNNYEEIKEEFTGSIYEWMLK